MERLRWFHRAAKYYRIARNFERVAEQFRYDRALTALDAITHQITEENVSETVWNLTQQFETIYNRYAMSAASKLLWIRHRSPVIIYDGQARYTLNKFGCRLREGNYKAYREQWLKHFATRADAIQSACEDVLTVRRFSLAHPLPDDEATTLLNSRWFHERVFDKFLWRTGAT